MKKTELENLNFTFFLPLLSAAAVKRKEKEFRKLLKFAVNKNYNPVKIYEALLQTYLFAGFPSALISIKIFSEYFNYNGSVEKYDSNEFSLRGISNCKRVYGKKFDKLISNVNSFSSELSNWLIIEGYGKTLGRKSLSMKERELSIVSILAVLRFEEQLISHIIGAERFGNSFDEIKESLKKLKLIGELKNSIRALEILKKVNFRIL